MKVDSIIFDMDGTLWDNVNSYVIAWNKGLGKTGHTKRVTRNEMMSLMGKMPKSMMEEIIPGSSKGEQTDLFDVVIDSYHEIVDTMQPYIYPGVTEGLEKLSKKYKLLLLSNCEKDGLVHFMRHTKTTHLITDYMEHGQNFQPKSFNIRLLSNRNNLQSPVYVGDTASDSKESALAGVPFIYASYGFGNTNDYTMKFDAFTELTDYFITLE